MKRAWSKPAVSLVLILAGFILAIDGAGYVYYRKQREAVRQAACDQLNAIADLKVGQLARWRQERLQDARLALEVGQVTDVSRRYLAAPEDGDARDRLLAFMAAFLQHKDYRRVLLLDAQLRPRLAVPPAEIDLVPELRPFAAEAVRTNQVVVSDLRAHPLTRLVCMHFFLPLLGPRSSDGALPEAGGVLMIEIDAHEFLFPHIQSWPAPSQTAETLLVRRENNDVVYLNDLRHRAGSALRLRFPLATNSQLPATRAVLGETNIVEGLDYRQQPVLAALRGVPDSPWFLVAKQDQAEVYAPLWQLAYLISIVAMGLILATGFGVGWVWRNREYHFARRELADHQQAEEAIRRERMLLRTVIDNLPHPIYVKDLAGRKLLANPAEVRAMGFQSESEALGKKDIEIYQAEVAETFERDDRRVLEAGETILNQEETSIDLSGRRRWLLTSKLPFRDVEQKVIGLVGIGLDVTQHKQIELQLAKASQLKQRLLGASSLEEKLKTITDAAVDFLEADFARIWLTDKGDLCHRGCHHAEVTEGPNVCRDRTRCLHLMASSGRYTHLDGPHRRVPLGCYKIGRVAAGDEPGFITNDVQNDPRVHNRQWAKELGLSAFAGYRLTAATGQTVGVLALFRKHPIAPHEEALLEDLAHTASQVVMAGLADAALRREAVFIHTLLDNLTDGVVACNAEGIPVLCNPAARQWHGTELVNVPPGQWSQHCDLLAADTESPLPVERFPLVRAHQGEQLRDLAMSVRVPGYRARYLLVSGGPFFEAGGEKLGAVVVMRDHTERRQMEQERERLTKELQQKNEELESLIYAASHDLRSPLVNIEGFSRRLGLVCQELAGLADHPALPAELRQRTSALTQVQLPKAMHYIQAGVTKMGGLINGLLRLSRLGRVSVTLEPLDMNRLLLQVLAALTYQIQKAEAEVVVGSLPRCQGDQNLLNQVFSNLLDNALKYRDPVRRLQIRVSGRREGADVLYCVEDTGIGIAPEHQERVWELFHRLRPEGPVAGEGLGLNLVRRIVGRHQGRIWLESAPGVGSRFIIALPVAPP